MDKKQITLADRITMIFAQQQATFRQACSAMMEVMIYGALKCGSNKATMTKCFADAWDGMEPVIRKVIEEEDGELVIVAPDVASITDPAKKEALADFLATLRQRVEGIKSGEYANIVEVLDSLGGKRIEDEDELPDDVRDLFYGKPKLNG